MSKVPVNEDTPQSHSPPVPHEGNTHHHELQTSEYQRKDMDLGTAHHALRGHRPVSVPIPNDSDSALQDEIARQKDKSGIMVRTFTEKASLEEQEQSGIQRGFGDENEEFPEGGLKAWSVVLGSFFALFSALGMMNTIGIYQAYLSRNDLKDSSAGQLGWIFSTHVFLAFFCGVQIGPIFDKRGPRELVLTGSVGVVSTYFLISICKEYWQYFLVFGVLGGISASCLFTPSIAAVGHWFRTGRANATGLAITGGSVGGIIFPFVFQQLMPKIGFPWACRVAGFMQLGLLIPANLLIRSRLKPLPDAKAAIDFSALRSPVFALTTFATFLTEWGITIPITYLPSYAIDRGASEGFSFLLMAIFNVGSVFGRWLPSFIADFSGRYNMSVLMSICSFAVILGLWLPSGDSGDRVKAMLMAAAVACGFFSGSGIGLIPVCIGQICRTEDYGKRYGTCYCLASFASFTGIPLAGLILSTTGSYNGLIWLNAAAYMGAALSFAAARVVQVGWSPKTVF